MNEWLYIGAHGDIPIQGTFIADFALGHTKLRKDTSGETVHSGRNHAINSVIYKDLGRV